MPEGKSKIKFMRSAADGYPIGKSLDFTGIGRFWVNCDKKCIWSRDLYSGRETCILVERNVFWSRDLFCKSAKVLRPEHMSLDQNTSLPDLRSPSNVLKYFPFLRRTSHL